MVEALLAGAVGCCHNRHCYLLLRGDLNKQQIGSLPAKGACIK